MYEYALCFFGEYLPLLPSTVSTTDPVPLRELVFAGACPKSFQSLCGRAPKVYCTDMSSQRSPLAVPNFAYSAIRNRYCCLRSSMAIATDVLPLPSPSSTTTSLACYRPTLQAPIAYRDTLLPSLFSYLRSHPSKF